MRPRHQRIRHGAYPFAVVLRTQGNRPALLAEALFSVSIQAVRALAVVVVHGSQTVVSQVHPLCEQTENLDYVLLRAGEKGKKRGYPLNVGLDFCYQSDLPIDNLFFLDDDDVVYPFFTLKLSQAFMTKAADLICAASNRRVPGELPQAGYFPRHPVHLFVENHIPINGYAVRLKPLKQLTLYFDTSLDYLEDWHFLLQLLENGLRFESIEESLSEFRITSDGNTREKKAPMDWKRASLQVRGYINRGRFSINGDMLAKIAHTPVSPAKPAASPAVPLHQIPARELIAVLFGKAVGRIRREWGSLLRRLSRGSR